MPSSLAAGKTLKSILVSCGARLAPFDIEEVRDITMYDELSLDTVGYNTSDTRGNSPSYGTNYQKVGHDLASVDELAVLDGGKCILQLRGVRPFKSDKYDLTQHPNYKLTAGADKKNTFSIEAFLDHRLKLKPGDKYEVVDADHAK